MGGWVATEGDTRWDDSGKILRLDPLSGYPMTDVRSEGRPCGLSGLSLPRPESPRGQTINDQTKGVRRVNEEVNE